MPARDIPLRLFEMLRWMLAYEDRHGYPPTYREVALGCNIPSISTVARLLERLETSGLIRLGGGARAMDLRPARRALNTGRR